MYICIMYTRREAVLRRGFLVTMFGCPFFVNVFSVFFWFRRSWGSQGNLGENEENQKFKNINKYRQRSRICPRTLIWQAIRRNGQHCYFVTLTLSFFVTLSLCYCVTLLMNIRFSGFVTLVVWNDISNAFSSLSSCNREVSFHFDDAIDFL